MSEINGSEVFADPSILEATANARRDPEGTNQITDINEQATISVSDVVAPLPELPPAYTQSAAQQAVSEGQAELQRRLEELERKDELTRREQQIASSQYNPRRNNWPPLPACCPLKPCFYQDFAVDIPSEFQRTVKLGYYLWLTYALVLFLNMWIALVYMCVRGVDHLRGVCFGVALSYVCILVPVSYIAWFRNLYNAFRSDCSRNFFGFFFISVWHVICNIVQMLGFNHVGTVGWINGIVLMGSSSAQQRIVAGCMLIMAVFFLTLAILHAIYLVKVHALYRHKGLMFSNAPVGVTTGNPQVQTATREPGVATLY